MTESRPPYRTAGGTAHPASSNQSARADEDTTALPRLSQPVTEDWSQPTQAVPSVPPPAPKPSSGIDSGDSGPSEFDEPEFEPADFEPAGRGAGRPPVDSGSETPGPLTAIGSKLTAAGAAAVAAATSAAASAANTAKEAMSNIGSGAAAGSNAGGIGSAGFGSTAYPGSAAGAGYGATAMAPGAPGTARAAAPSQAAKAARGRGTGRQPRKARLTLSHVNVYSVFKLSCVLAIALFFVWLIMVGVLYGVLDVAGVFTKINDTVGKISGGDNPKAVVTGSLVFGSAIIIGAVYIVLFIALSTIGSMVYNLCADLVGGVEVTLSERE